MDDVFEAKLHQPPARANWVRRGRLLDVLDRAVRRPVTVVTAPAGYGKTTLLAQWLAEPDRPATAWLSLDTGDDNPDRLWAHVAVALRRAGCILPAREPLSPHGDLHEPAFTRSLLPALSNALAAHPEEIVLVLDDLHCVRERVCHEQIQHLIATLPPHAHLVLLTRSDPALRLGRLRASGDLTELRASDLGFTEAEAHELLAGEDVHVTEESVATLLERTEGWPAGLYLATLSLAGLSDPDEFVERFGGGNRFIGDYLVEEVLSRQDDRVRQFIGTASLLDRFSAPLCDHVTGTDDARTILRDLERSNLFVVPLDEEHQWFRFHHLFAAVARSTFELRDPDVVREVHTRAADWFVQHGQTDQAVEHLLAAGRTDEVAHVVAATWLTYVDLGRRTTIAAWLEALGPEVQETNVEARTAAAWIAAMEGDLPTLERHVAALSEVPHAETTGPLPDGTRSLEEALLLIRAVFAYAGPLDALEAAGRAVELETDERSPFHALALQALGHAAYVLGDLDVAVPALREASASAGSPVIVRVHSLALLSLVQEERGDPVGARMLAERANEIVGSRGLRATAEASLALTALGLAQAFAGKLEDALVTLEEDLDPRRQPRAVASWSSTHHLLATARVAALAGRMSMAKDLVDQVLHRLARYPSGTEAMRVRVARVQVLLRDEAAAEALGEPLTRRELDVLRLLQSDLTPQEIADELYLTFNTVKTHAAAVYRKLGAHSRAEAVVEARRRALL